MNGSVQAATVRVTAQNRWRPVYVLKRDVAQPLFPVLLPLLFGVFLGFFSLNSHAHLALSAFNSLSSFLSESRGIVADYLSVCQQALNTAVAVTAEHCTAR